MKQTQKDRLLQAFIRAGEKGLNTLQMTQPRPVGLGIIEYTGRISDLRKDGHNIVNTEPNRYVLVQDQREKVSKEEPKSEPFDYERAKKQLQQLRAEYSKLLKLNRHETPAGKIILSRGKMLANALEQYDEVAKYLI